MADNVEANAGSGGAIFATDDVSSVHYPITKITIGALNSSGSLLSGGAGTIDGGCLRFTIATDDPAITSLQLLDNVVYVDDADWTDGTSSHLLIGGLYQSTPQTITDGDVGPLQVTANGYLIVYADQFTSIVNAVELIDDVIYADGADWVDGTSKHMLTGGLYQSSPQTIVDGDQGPLQVTANGFLIVSINGTPPVQVSPQTSGGCDVFRSIDLDETEEEVKATAGQVFGIIAINTATTPRYLKFYNATAATVVVGTTAPVLTIPIPAQSSGNGAGLILTLESGIEFDTAICVAATTGVADANTGAPGTNEVVVNVFYK